jgi:hypothetical protein
MMASCCWFSRILHYSKIPGSKKTGNFVREFSGNILLRVLARPPYPQFEVWRHLISSRQDARSRASRASTRLSTSLTKLSSSSGGLPGGCSFTIDWIAFRTSASETFLGGTGKAAGASAEGSGTSASAGGASGGSTSIPMGSWSVQEELTVAIPEVFAQLNGSVLASTSRAHRKLGSCQLKTCPGGKVR